MTIRTLYFGEVRVIEQLETYNPSDSIDLIKNKNFDYIEKCDETIYDLHQTFRGEIVATLDIDSI